MRVLVLQVLTKLFNCSLTSLKGAFSSVFLWLDKTNIYEAGKCFYSVSIVQLTTIEGVFFWGGGFGCCMLKCKLAVCYMI